MSERISSFEDFWPFYLSQHAHPTCRKLHFVGTSIVVGLAGTALATGQWWLMAGMPIAGYGFAWAGHFLVEKNRPATFTYPVWSLGADFVMWWKMLTGTLDAELERHGVRWPPDRAERPLQAV